MNIFHISGVVLFIFLQKSIIFTIFAGILSDFKIISLENNNKKKRSFIQRLKNKYRLVIMNDDTLEEKFSFKLSRLNVFVASGTGIILLIIITTYIIAFTPLREYIPGYGSNESNRKIRKYCDEYLSFLCTYTCINNVQKPVSDLFYESLSMYV